MAYLSNFFRHFSNTSLALSIACVFLGNGVVSWTGRQIRMDVIVGMMPSKVRDAINLFSELVFIVAALMIVAFSWPVIRDLYAFDQRSQSAEIPMYIPQSLVPIGLSIMAFLVVVRLITGGDPEAPGNAGH